MLGLFAALPLRAALAGAPALPAQATTPAPNSNPTPAWSIVAKTVDEMGVVHVTAVIGPRTHADSIVARIDCRQKVVSLDARMLETGQPGSQVGAGWRSPAPGGDAAALLDAVCGSSPAPRAASGSAPTSPRPGRGVPIFQVQFGAYPTRAQAQARLAALAQAYPEISGRSAAVRIDPSPSAVRFRALASIVSLDAAQDLCRRANAAGDACWVRARPVASAAAHQTAGR